MHRDTERQISEQGREMEEERERDRKERGREEHFMLREVMYQKDHSEIIYRKKRLKKPCKDPLFGRCANCILEMKYTIALAVIRDL